MGKHVVVRYTTSLDAAEENTRLVADVFGALAEAGAEGISYSAYRLDDGVTFVHVAELTGSGNPLLELPAFAEFQRGLAGRCEDGPTPSSAELIASYTNR